MSQHRFNAVFQGTAVRVTLGFDRPLQYFFLNVDRINSEGEIDYTDLPDDDACDLNDDMPDDVGGPVYASLYDPHAPRHDLGYFREKLRKQGIEVPQSMFEAVEKDMAENVGNKVVNYAADGSPLQEGKGRGPDPTPLHLGQFKTPLGTLLVYRQYYQNWTVGIQLCDQDGTPMATLSVNIVEAASDLAADEFFVKNWSENEPLIAPALASGLFEDTGRKGPPTGFTGTCPPVWRIRSTAVPKPKALSTGKQLHEPVAKIALALRKFAAAASTQLGSDCYVHAALGRALLADLGFEAHLMVGYAAWRVGPGDGDVIGHTPQATGVLPPGVDGFAYHTWLECEGFVVDFTTYQLRRKAQMLDAADGGRTTVDWCPDCLLLPRAEIRSYKEVAAALKSGVAHYEVRTELEPLLQSRYSLDPQDLQAARLIAANPQEMVVIGPNNWPTDSSSG